MLFDPKVKPRLWNLKLGVLVRACAQMGLPPPVLAMPYLSGMVADLSGNNNYDSVVGTITPVGDYLDFPGTNNYIDCGNKASIQITGPMSVVMGIWVDVDTNAKTGKHADGDHGWLVGRNASTDTVEWRISSDGTDWSGGVTSVSSFPITTWLDIVCVYDGSYMRVYINGVEDTGGDFPLAYNLGINNSTTNLCVGHVNYYPADWDGRFKYFYLFPVGINLVQVQTLRNNPYGMFGPIRNPAIWSFVSGGGETFYKTVVGALPNPDGTVNTILVYGRSVYGDMPNTTGSIVKGIDKSLVGSCPSSEGDIVRSIDKGLVGNQPNALADLDTIVVQKKSILGDMPESNATLSLKLVGTQGMFGNFPNVVGVIAKKISKYLAGNQPTSRGDIVKSIGKNLVGNQPNTTGSVRRKITTKQIGIMGTISGVVSSILNPVGPGIVKLYKLIGSSLKKFIG